METTGVSSEIRTLVEEVNDLVITLEREGCPVDYINTLLKSALHDFVITYVLKEHQSLVNEFNAIVYINDTIKLPYCTVEIKADMTIFTPEAMEFTAKMIGARIYPPPERRKILLVNIQLDIPTIREIKKRLSMEIRQLCYHDVQNIVHDIHSLMNDLLTVYLVGYDDISWIIKDFSSSWLKICHDIDSNEIDLAHDDDFPLNHPRIDDDGTIYIKLTDDGSITYHPYKLGTFILVAIHSHLQEKIQKKRNELGVT